MAVTIGEICDAIEAVLSGIAEVKTGQSFDELAEGLNAADLPLIQVYFESFNMDPYGTTDRSSFRGGIRQKPFVIHADLHAAQRGPNLSQENKTMVDTVDAIIDELETQNTKDYFAEAGIKAWSVSCARTLFDYAGALYVGARFIFTITVF